MANATEGALQETLDWMDELAEPFDPEDNPWDEGDDEPDFDEEDD